MQEMQVQSLGQEDALEKEILQYFCLGNPMDRGAWWATIHGVAKSRTQLRAFPIRMLALISSLYFQH